MKKLLVFLFLGFGLAQASDFKTVKEQLEKCTGLNYQGFEFHTILKSAADLINNNDENRSLIYFVALQFQKNKILNNVPKQKENILNNFLQNIDEQKRESVKREIDYYCKGLDLSFEREKKLKSIVYGAGLGISCLSFFKKPDLMYGGLATVFLTGFVLNNKKTTGMPYDRIKQQNKIWWNTLYSAGLIYSGFSLFKKPDLFNIGLATFSLTRLFYNNRNIDYDTSEGKKRHDEGMFDSILLTGIMTSGYSLHKKETNLNKALFAGCLQLFVKNKLEGYK